MLVSEDDIVDGRAAHDGPHPSMTPAGGAALVLCVSACGSTGRRSSDDLIDQLVDGGLERGIAECVVEQFFDERSDDELQRSSIVMS